jgi:hypothetical protein
MKRLISLGAPILVAFSSLLAGCAAAPPPDTGIAPGPVVPLVNAHAHNDYAHERPLLDALDHGFCSVEADVHLVDGRLLVAHDRRNVRPDRTLEALYFDPLRERVQINGGRVYRNGPEVTLLIDFKSEAEATYTALRQVLNDYAEMLTVFRPDGIEHRAVAVIISGNRPRETMAAEARRYCAMDGRLGDLESDAPVHLIPLISESWHRVFAWRGFGPMSESDRQKLEALVERIHKRGCRVRFWAAPDRLAAWRELRVAGVDLINTDNLTGLQQFLLTQKNQDQP